jgi:hypothetical protein
MIEEVQTLNRTMRNLNDIRTEIEAATERRTELWHILSEEGHNAEVADELEQLNARIDALWVEHRQTRATLLHGDRDQIIQRARAEERLSRAA